MDNPNLGVETLKQVALDAVNVVEEVAEAAGDGVQLTDAIVVFNNLGRIQRVAANAKQALAELKDLTPDETSDVVEHVVANSNLDDDGAEGKIKRALRLVARAHRVADDAIDLVGDAKAIFA
jgi:hypothetical protein